MNTLCVFMCACVCVYMCAFVCECVCVCVRVCECACVYMCVFVRVRACVRVQEEIATLYDSFRKNNDGKNLLSAARSPAVLFTVSMIFYVASTILGLLGLESLASLSNLLMFLFIGLLLMWVYTRYSGEHRQLAIHIDQLAEVLWEHVSGLFIAGWVGGG